MPARPIVRFPDARLRMHCAPVTTFDDVLARLASDLVDTMRAAPGIGITAAHIGMPERVVIIELPSDTAPRIYVNPTIIDCSKAVAAHEEGSVSMPGIVETIERPATVTVRYQRVDGTAAEETADGLLAVCLQHEIDQLDGIFFLQRLSRLKRERAVRRLEKRTRS